MVSIGSLLGLVLVPGRQWHSAQSVLCILLGLLSSQANKKKAKGLYLKIESQIALEKEAWKHYSPKGVLKKEAFSQYPWYPDGGTGAFMHWQGKGS